MIVEKKREVGGEARESLYRPGFLPAAGWLVFLPSRDPIEWSADEAREAREASCAVSVNYALTIGLRFNYIGQELGGSGRREVGRLPVCVETGIGVFRVILRVCPDIRDWLTIHTCLILIRWAWWGEAIEKVIDRSDRLIMKESKGLLDCEMFPM